QIWMTRKVDGVWTPGTRFVVDGITGDTNCPVFVPGDDGMYFLNVNQLVFTIYHVTRTESGWGNPVALDLNIPVGKILGWSFSIADNHNVYFSLWPTDGLEPAKIYYCIYQDGVYGDPIAIDVLNVSTVDTGRPCIAPDESYILFDAVLSSGRGQHDIYVSFKNDMGVFAAPISLGALINSSEEDSSPQLTADGKYLFFMTYKAGDMGYNAYWIELEEIPIFAVQ
ncbi:MAG: hypothetical protein V1761_02645, partial [bacterium]